IEHRQIVECRGGAPVAEEQAADVVAAFHIGAVRRGERGVGTHAELARYLIGAVEPERSPAVGVIRPDDHAAVVVVRARHEELRPVAAARCGDRIVVDVTVREDVVLVIVRRGPGGNDGAPRRATTWRAAIRYPGA